MSDCKIRPILMMELDTVADAIRNYVTDTKMTRDERDEELNDWMERLSDVRQALYQLDNSMSFTPLQRTVLSLLVDFHVGSDAPVDQRTLDELVEMFKKN